MSRFVDHWAFDDGGGRFCIPDDFEYFHVLDEEQMEELAEHLINECVWCVSFDVETCDTGKYTTENYLTGKVKKTGKDLSPVLHPSGRVICASLAWRNASGAVEAAFIDGGVSSEAIEALRLILANPDTFKLAQNATFDINWLSNYGVDVRGPVIDTLVMDFYFDEDGRRGMHGLEQQVNDHLGLRKKTYKQTFTQAPSEGKKKGTLLALDDVYLDDEDMLIRYSLSDPIATLFLFEFHCEVLSHIPWSSKHNYLDLFFMMEPMNVEAARQMEVNGMLPNQDILCQKGEIIEAAFDENMEAFLEWAGCMVNPNSPAQIKALLFGPKNEYTEVTKKTVAILGHGWPILSRDEAPPKCFNEKGELGTGTDTLEIYANSDLISAEEKRGAELLLQARSLRKAQSNYGWGLFDFINPRDSRVHTNVNRIGSVTWRWSSRDPNLLNQPNPGKDKFKLREVWTARPGHKLIVCDEDQFEIKLIAEATGDDKFIEDVSSGLDLHAIQGVNLCPYLWPHIDTSAYPLSDEGLHRFKKDHPDERSVGKTVNFATLYGQSYFTLASALGITSDEAKAIQTAVFEIYPGLPVFFDWVKGFVVEHGYIRNLFNVIRRLPNAQLPLPSRNDKSPEAKRTIAKIRASQREAINFIPQSSAAVIIKLCLGTIAAHPEYSRMLADLGYRLLIQVHDEIVGECPEETAEEAADIIKYIMENPFEPYQEYFSEFKMRVPLSADMKIVDNWAQAK